MKRIEHKRGVVRAQFSLPITLCPARVRVVGKELGVEPGKRKDIVGTGIISIILSLLFAIPF